MVSHKDFANRGNIGCELIRTFIFTAIVGLTGVLSCGREEPEIHEIPGIALDELSDQTELTGSLEVNCTSYLGQTVEKVLVNGKEHPLDESLELEESGFYRLEIYLEGEGTTDPGVIRIVILDEERGEAEWGIRKWTPVVPPTGALGSREVILIYPPVAPSGANVPLIVLLEKDPDPAVKILEATAGPLEFIIKRETGSVQIPPGREDIQSVSIEKKVFPLNVTYFEEAPQELGGTVTADLQIPADANIRIVADVHIPSGVTLSVESGAFLSVDPAVNIYCEGSLLIHGLPQRPVTITCTEPEEYWGGIIGSGTGNRMEASHAIFCKSGYHASGDFAYGHANRQALVYNENGTLKFDHCYFLDQAGQVFYPVSSTIELTNCLVQRAMTSGQLNNSEVTISNTVFADFPNDSYDYLDEDNDALYLMECNATITDCLFTFAKDDGLDSGGSGGGVVNVLNSRFEVIFHEGAALSSAGDVIKHHYFTGCTFMNCGQGLELGYSSPNHLVTVDSCLFRENGIGIRYGDNYTGRHRGTLQVLNSKSIYNESYDVWNLIRDTWSADTLKMEFDNVWVTKENPMYPELKLYE